MLPTFAPRAARRHMVPVVATILLLSAACGGSGIIHEPDGEGNTLITVGLINGDANAGLPIHLFGPGEDFPCCQVAPLSNRDFRPSVKNGDALTFRAGRSGNIIKTVTCTVDNLANKIVRWTPTATGASTGTLSCHTGW